jgi:hypothetical protein
MRCNPFVYGAPVCGDTFFGREKELSLLWSRLIAAVQPGCCSVVGETRIGKSSLKEEFLQRVRNERPNDVFVVDLNVASDFQTGTTVDFYRQLFGLLADEMALVDGIDRLSLVQAGEPDVPWSQIVHKFKRFLKSVRSADILLLIVMDEFDYMEQHFRFEPQGWNVLRDLAYSPDTPLIYLTLSRRPLSDIENDLRISSNFAGVFGEPIRLSRFCREEAMSLITESTRRQGVTWPSGIPAMVLEYTGGHPYLIQMTCFHLYEWFCQGEPLTDLIPEGLSARLSGELYSFLNMLRQRLHHKSMFTTLLKVAHSAPVDTEVPKLDELVRLGYLDRLSDGVYRPFSPVFEEYLKCFRFTEELWPILGCTERGLRCMVQTRYQSEFGEGWLSVIAANNKVPGKEYSIVDEWRWAQERELGNAAVQDAASLSLLDYSYIDQLGQLINQQKQLFVDFLGQRNSPQRRRVQDAINQLSLVRNPSAHFRPVTPDAVTATHLACQTLLETIPAEFLSE